MHKIQNYLRYIFYDYRRLSVLIISIIFVLLVSNYISMAPDSLGYIQAAENFKLGCFSDISSNLQCLKPTLNWHPLYPFTLFLISKLGLSYIFSIPFQSILFTIASYFCSNSLYKLTLQKIPFFIIYLLILLCPVTIQWHRWILMDSFLTSCSLFIIGFACEIIRERKLKAFILFLITLILGYHLKISIVVFIFSLFLLTLNRFPIKNFSKRKSLIIVFLIILISFSPIQIRNYILWKEPLFSRLPTNNKAYAPGYYEWLKTHILSESDMVNYLNPLLSDNIDQILEYTNSYQFTNKYLNNIDLLKAKDIISNRVISEEFNLSFEDDKKFKKLSENFWTKKNFLITKTELFFKRSFILLIDPPNEWQFNEEIEDSGVSNLFRKGILSRHEGLSNLSKISKVNLIKLSYRYLKYIYRYFIILICLVSVFEILKIIIQIKTFNTIFLSDNLIFSLFCISVIIPFLIMHSESIALEQRYISTLFPFITALSINSFCLVIKKFKKIKLPPK